MEIPLIDAGRGGAVALYEARPAETRALVRTALGAHPLLRASAPIADRVSRRWLERQQNPYRHEIGEVARRLGTPGAYLLNIVYEWACSTATGPDPAGDGARMVRILDWGMKGIGRYLVLARHETDAGPYVAATWPGYAGLLTAMAPGRFAAAVNQAPSQAMTGLPVFDDITRRLRLLRSRAALPAAHLLRRVFETAPGYAAAAAMLMETRVALAMPAIFVLSGTSAEEGCVIEARGRERVLHAAGRDGGWVVATANAWLGGWEGTPRLHAHVRRPGDTPQRNNDDRRRLVCDIHRGAELRAPVLNRHTVLAARMNARRGRIEVDAYDFVAGKDLPQVVASGAA